MDFYEPLFSPSDVQEKCLIYPSTLRDWRSRDFSKHIGTVGQNGRWKYSAVDMVELAIANLATRSGIEGFLAFGAAKQCAGVVFHFWGAPVDPKPERYVYFWRRNPVWLATPVNQMFNWDRTDDLTNIATEGCAVAFLFDGSAFAEQYRAFGDWIKDKLESEVDD